MKALHNELGNDICFELTNTKLTSILPYYVPIFTTVRRQHAFFFIMFLLKTIFLSNYFN